MSRPLQLAGDAAAGRGALELWAGRLDAATAAFQAGARSAGPEGAYERAGCLGHLALLEAWQGRLSGAVERAERGEPYGDSLVAAATA